MKIDPKELGKIIETAIDKAGLGLGQKDCMLLTDEIHAIVGREVLGERYLYNLYKACLKAIQTGKKSIGINENYINAILQYLGARNLREYQKKQAAPKGDPRLAGLVGNWYSIVRQNSGLPNLLVAPVSIWQAGSQFWIRMIGPADTYEAELVRKETAVYANFVNDRYKVINLIFHIGGSTRPQLLMGVFSGVSTAGDVIAGREFLLRMEEEEAEMEHHRIRLDDESKWPQWIDPRIFSYFGDDSRNCLKGTRGPTFTLDDLDVVS